MNPFLSMLVQGEPSALLLGSGVLLSVVVVLALVAHSLLIGRRA